jgi:hypothetical protein
MRADRLVSIALLLQARGRMSAQELAGELEVSVRTIYRDISALNTAEIPVVAEPGPRVADLPAAPGAPRARALAVLRNFHDNLRRPDSLPVVGTLLAEERHHPELLNAFRSRLVEPRRALLRDALADAVEAGELPQSADPEVLASMLIGSFYARYLAASVIPDDWAERTLRQAWPDRTREAPG